MKNKKARLSLIVFGLFFLLPLAGSAGYDCSYSSVSSDIPEGTSDQKCIDEYYACQDKNNADYKVWGNCTGWGADPGVNGCHGHTREAWLINPTLCPADYKNDKQFQPDYSWGDANMTYCTCVEACGPQPAAKDCFPVLEECCSGLAVTADAQPSPAPSPTVQPKEECPETTLSASARLNTLLNQYYDTIPEGPTKSGRLNNIYNVFSDDFSEFACGGYQSRVLDMLDSIKWSDDCATAALLDGFDYGPIESYFKWHQAVVIYPSGTDWLETGLVLDPWPNQKPEVYTIQDWALKFSKGSYYGIAGSSAYDNGYPTVGGAYVDPAVQEVEAKEVKDFQKTLSPEKLKKFKTLTSDQRKAYVHWLTEKSKVRLHIHSPVRVMVTDSKGNQAGENAQGEFMGQTDEIFMRTEQMDDEHYAYDIYAPEGEYGIEMTGIAKGKVMIVSAIYNNKKESFNVQQGSIDIKKGELIKMDASSKKGSIASKQVDFKTVKKAEDIKNLPKPSSAPAVDDISAWFTENWALYFDEPAVEQEIIQPAGQTENLNFNTITWILYGLAGLIFFAAVITAVVLLVLKKKFIIIVLIFIPLLFVSCGLGGAATWKLFTDINEAVPEPGRVIINTATDTAVNMAVVTSTSAVKAPVPVSAGIMENNDYGYTIDVGDKYADKFKMVSVSPEGYSQASFMYCYDTNADYADTFYCPEGYAPSFNITVMTKKQWDDAKSGPMNVYDLITSASNRYFLFSHPNGLLPEDVPATDKFYDQVKNSFEFIP